jgi:hypothetical protein
MLHPARPTASTDGVQKRACHPGRTDVENAIRDRRGSGTTSVRVPEIIVRFSV